MKKKIVIALSAAMSSCALGYWLAACADKEEPPAHKHAVTFVAENAATCTEDGNIAYYACGCGKLFSDENATAEIVNHDSIILDRLGHSVVPHGAKSATCTEDGWNAHEDCLRCDYTTKTVIPAHHVYTDYICDVCAAVDPTAPYTSGLEYTEITENGQIVGYSVSKSSAETGKYIKIPNEHNGKPVTSIGNSAFKNCVDLTRIEIPYGVTSIGAEAFLNCTNLSSITIPSTATSIGVGAFQQCTSLTNIDIPSEVASIEERTFFGCSSLENATFAENSRLTAIRGYAFFNCGSLTKIEIPHGVTVIDNNAFCNCVSLKSVTIHDSIATVGNGVFNDCPIEFAEMPASVIMHITQSSMSSALKPR